MWTIAVCWCCLLVFRIYTHRKNHSECLYRIYYSVRPGDMQSVFQKMRHLSALKIIDTLLPFHMFWKRVEYKNLIAAAAFAICRRMENAFCGRLQMAGVYTVHVLPSLRGSFLKVMRMAWLGGSCNCRLCFPAICRPPQRLGAIGDCRSHQLLRGVSIQFSLYYFSNIVSFTELSVSQ